MPTELNREGRLSQVLGIFNKLVASPSTEELGFFVLNTVVENRGSDVFAPYIGHIWIALFLKVVSTLLILSLLASMSFQSVYTLSDFVVVQGSNTILVAGAKSCTAESSI